MYKTYTIDTMYKQLKYMRNILHIFGKIFDGKFDIILFSGINNLSIWYKRKNYVNIQRTNKKD